MANFINELKRRSVFRVGIAYLVVAWLALQLTDLVFENMNAPDWVMQAIMLVLAVGFPIALVLAWAFEVKADGVQRDSEDSPGLASNSRLFYAIVGIISVAAIGLFLWQQSDISTTTADSSAEATPEGADTKGDDSESLLAIAVLPFESFTEDREDQYFADGLADTLLHKLAQLETLTVIARNSSFQYKGKNVDVREVGQELGVPTVLEGSVQRQGDQIRVIAQLVSTADGAHWWSGTFDGTFENIFELQDEIAAAIAVQLQVTLSEQDRERLYRRGTTVPEAYETLARARAIDTDSDSADFDPDDNARIKLLREVVELDPNYGRGWASLSNYYNHLAFLDTDNSRFDEFVAESMASARKAIEVDPNESMGYVSLGFGHWRMQERPEAEEAYRRALAINPNSDGALAGLGLILLLNNPEEAYRLFKRTQEIDPNSIIVYRQLFLALSGLGRLEEGVAQLAMGIEKAPGFFLLYEDLARTYSQNFGLPDKAAKVMSDLLRRDTDSRAGMGAMAEYWLAVDDVQRATAWNDQLLEKAPSDTGAREMRIALLQQQGDIDSALAVADTLSSQGFASVGRNLRFLELCVSNGDHQCAIEHLEHLVQFLTTFEARSGQTLPGISAVFDYFSGRLLYPNEAAARDALQKAAGTFARFTLLGSGSADVDSRHLYLAEILTLQGRKNEAIEELFGTLEIADGGFVGAAPSNVRPEKSKVLAELSGHPGYEKWLTEFTARRTAMREKMIAMEAAGEIAQTP